MISRGQRILFWTLLVSSVLMAVVLLRMRERAMDRLLASGETMPLNPPAGRPVQSVTMMMANDMDGSVQTGKSESGVAGGRQRARTCDSAAPDHELCAAQFQASDCRQQRRERNILHDPAAGGESSCAGYGCGRGSEHLVCGCSPLRASSRRRSRCYRSSVRSTPIFRRSRRFGFWWMDNSATPSPDMLISRVSTWLPMLLE